MATGGRMAMNTEAAVLTLAQWFSPAFPVGAFHFSGGLEWAIEAGLVGDADSLRDWIADVLRDGSGKADASFLAAAFVADEAQLSEIDATARAFAPSAERLFETVETGRAFGLAVAAVHGLELPELTYPVAVGRAARLMELPEALTAQMYLHATVANLAAVGMRLIPLGQTEGQRIIAGLLPLAREVAEATAEGDLDRLGTCAFMADVASMRHETQYSRIFRT